MTIHEHTADIFSTVPADNEFLDIESLVKTKLKPIPVNAARIMSLLQKVETTTHEISEAIGYDIALASRVMRLANSPMYAMQREISTVHAAVAAVGNRSIYDIVMLSVASDSISREMRSMKTGVSIWEHSVAVALASRAISKELNLRATEEAFVCGLLHDMGKNILFQADQLRYTETELAQNSEDASELEKRIFGFDHSQVGFYVSRRWGLADQISSTILSHHDPKNAVQAVAVAHIVNVADDLVTRKGMGLQIETPDTLPKSLSVDLLKLTDDQMERAWESTEANLAGILSNCN